MARRHVSEYSPCRVPLVRVRFWDGIQPEANAAWVVVHEGIKPNIQRIEARLIAKNRQLVSEGKKPYLVRKGDTGAYNCRKTTSGRSWSKHSWGAAVDVNWTTNPFSSRRVTDMPEWFVQLWRDEGFGWGGNWMSVYDTMHYSKFPNEGGDGWLYSEDEEDEMKEEDFKRLEAYIHQEIGLLALALLAKNPEQAQEGGSHFTVSRGASLMDVAVAARNNARKAMENTATPPVPPASDPDPLTPDEE